MLPKQNRLAATIPPDQSAAEGSVAMTPAPTRAVRAARLVAWSSRKDVNSSDSLDRGSVDNPSLNLHAEISAAPSSKNPTAAM
jgi:hypothetical protein